MNKYAHMICLEWIFFRKFG